MNQHMLTPISLSFGNPKDGPQVVMEQMIMSRTNIVNFKENEKVAIIDACDIFDKIH